VTVNFQLDVNAILDVAVTERKSGKRVSERLKADRQRLSPDEIAQSQARLAAAYEGGGTADLEIMDPGVTVLLDRAQMALDRPDLDGLLAAEIAGTIADIRRAAAEEDNEQVEEHCDHLIDLLLEVEE